MKKKFVAIVIAAITAIGMTSCGKENASENHQITPVDYSYGLTDEGYYEGVNLSDYVTLPENYKALTFAKEDVLVGDEEWNEYYDYLASNIGEKQVLPDAIAEDGSFVTVDFSGTIDGVPFTGGSAEGVNLQIGSGQYLEQLESGIIGHKAGDTFTVEVQFPADYGTTVDENGNELDLSEKSALFEITLQSVNQYVLTDEAIADYYATYNENVDNEEEKITNTESLKNLFVEKSSQTDLENAIVEKVMAETKISEIPATVLEAYITVEMDIMRYNAESIGVSEEAFLDMNGFEKKEDYVSFVTDSATEYLKNRMMLLAIAEKEGIVYDDDACVECFGDDIQGAFNTYGAGYVTQNVICYKVIEMMRLNAVVQ